MVAAEKRVLSIEQAHAAAGMAGCGYNLQVVGKIYRLGTLDADFHRGGPPFACMHDPLGAKVFRKFFMARDVVTVCQKDIFHAAELFDALDQLRVEAWHVDEHVTPGAPKQVTRGSKGCLVCKAAEVDMLFELHRKRREDIPRECVFFKLTDGVHRARMQGLERCASFAFVFGLVCDISMVGCIPEKQRGMRVTSATVDAAIIDEEVTRGIFAKNRVVGIDADN